MPSLTSSGVVNLWAMDQYWSRPVRNQATQQEVSLNVMSSNHPETIPLQPLHTAIHGKLSAMELVPGAKKVGDPWPSLLLTILPISTQIFLPQGS